MPVRDPSPAALPPPPNHLRRWLSTALVLALVGLGLVLALRPDPLTAGLSHFLDDEHISGAVVADGLIGSPPRLLALGHAAPDRPMQPDDRFRLASLAKPITSAAIFALIETGRLSLDTPVPDAGPGITVRNLLQHSGGWDRSVTFDPISEPSTVARLGIEEPYSCKDVAERMPPAEFAPGTRYAYSNLGYCWLGALIESVTGAPYERFVTEAVLRPRGATLSFEGEPTVAYPNNWPAAAFHALGPGGGWLGTAADYWRFAAGPLDPRVAEKPPYAVPGEAYYGLGWRVWPDGGLSHFGAIEGLYTAVFRKDDRVTVLLFNGRPADDEQALVRLRRIVEAK